MERVIHCIYIRTLLASVSTDLPEVLQSCERTSLELDAGEVFLSLEALVEVLAQAQARLVGQWLPVLSGLAARPVNHGVIGTAILASRTLGEALATGVALADLRIRLAQFELAEHADGATLRILLDERCGPWRGTIGLMLLSAVVELIRSLGLAHLGKDASIDLPAAWRYPLSAETLAHFWGLRVQKSEQALVQIHLSSTLLAQPCLTADSAARRLALHECEALRRALDNAAAGWIGRVEQLVEAGLRNPVLHQRPTISRVATQLKISERTLIRRLRSEQATYRQVLDQVRARLAREQLMRAGLTVQEIATRLGYPDASNFSRAFRRLEGCSPSDWRAQHASVASAPRSGQRMQETPAAPEC